MGLEALVGASAWFPSLLLFLVRIGAFVVGQPLFGLQGESRKIAIGHVPANKVPARTARSSNIDSRNGVPVVRK